MQSNGPNLNQERRFKRILIVGNAPTSISDLPKRDSDTLVILPDKRLPWVGHFKGVGSALIVIDEMLSPRAAGRAETRAEQIGSFGSQTQVRLLFNTHLQVEEALKSVIVADETVLSYSGKGCSDHDDGGVGKAQCSNPMSDPAFLDAVFTDFAAEGAMLCFCYFDEEFRAMESQSEAALHQWVRSLLKRQHAVSCVKTSYDLEANVEPGCEGRPSADTFETTVSLIVPLFNAQTFIERTLRSVVEQGFESLEVVVVNDGSSDRSPELAKRFAGSFKKFTYIEQANAGVSAARNAGLAAASGRYIAFLDADDLLVPGSIERRVRFLDTSAFKICGGRTEGIDDDDRSLNLIIGRHDHRSYEDLWEPVFHISTIMGQSHILKSQQFRVGQKHAEDWQYLIDLAGVTDRIGSCGSAPLARYRWHRESVTAAKTIEHVDACLTLMSSLPIKPPDELGISMAMGGSIGMNGKRLHASLAERVQLLCLTTAFKDSSKPLDRRVIDLMNAIDDRDASAISDERFEVTLTRGLLLPRGSSELHLCILDRAPDVAKRFEALAATPANEAFIASFRRYVARYGILRNCPADDRQRDCPR